MHVECWHIIFSFETLLTELNKELSCGNIQSTVSSRLKLADGGSEFAKVWYWYLLQ